MVNFVSEKVIGVPVYLFEDGLICEVAANSNGFSQGLSNSTSAVATAVETVGFVSLGYSENSALTAKGLI